MPTINEILSSLAGAYTGGSDKVQWVTELNPILDSIVNELHTRGIKQVVNTSALSSQSGADVKIVLVDNIGFFKHLSTGTPNGTTIFAASGGGVWSLVLAPGSGGGSVSFSAITGNALDNSSLSTQIIDKGIPTYSNTAALSTIGQSDSKKALVLNNGIFVWQATGTPDGINIFAASDSGFWVRAFSVSGGSSAWGGISGTLSDQTDLQSVILEIGIPAVDDTTALEALAGTVSDKILVKDLGVFEFLSSGTPDGISIFPADGGGVWNLIASVAPNLEVENVGSAGEDLSFAEDNILKIKRLLAGDNITLTPNPDGSITIASAADPGSFISNQYAVKEAKDSWHTKARMDELFVDGKADITGNGTGTQFGFIFRTNSGNNILGALNNGTVRIGTFLQVYACTPLSGAQANSGAGWRFVARPQTDQGPSYVFTNENTRTPSVMSDNNINTGAMAVVENVTISTGPGKHACIIADGVVNQSGDATGEIDGIRIKQTITSQINYAAIRILTTAGKGVWQTVAAVVNYFNGKTGFGVSAPHTAIHTTGFASAINTTPKTGAYTIVESDNTITGDATGAAFNVTLPTAVGIAGREYVIKKIDASANAVTVVTTSSQTIDGATTYALATQWKFVRVKSDGANWLIIANN